MVRVEVFEVNTEFSYSDIETLVKWKEEKFKIKRFRVYFKIVMAP